MNPGIKNPGRGVIVRTAATYTASLNRLLPYYGLLSASGLIDAAWDLTLLGIDPGTHDIFGQPIPTIITHAVSGYDYGAAEYQVGQ